MPVWRPKIRALDNPTVNVGVRLERVDFNVGRFAVTGGKRFDEVNAVSLAVSFRPLSGTVFRLNYRLESFRDVLGNPAERTAAVRLGVATYF
jgi:outer membrane receptor protein involved in Fe transport